MKVFILYSTTDKPFGGANQFMRAMRRYFEKRGVLTRNIIKADVVFLNSHSLGGRHGRVFFLAYFLKLLFRSKIFVQRIDGPVQLYGGSGRANVDDDTYCLNESVVDGTIFQSSWSRERNRELGMREGRYETIIHNAADPSFFYPPTRSHDVGPVRLIATSWSNHPNKGFDIYEILDKSLDWNKFEMTFVGRSPRRFQNIRIIDAVRSTELGELLRSHDIFVAASRNESCSNALLEALSCGLPVVARNSGGHPELVKDEGELFENGTDVVAVIEKVSEHIEEYRQRIVAPTLEGAGRDYLDFISDIFQDVRTGVYRPKRISIWQTMSFLKRPNTLERKSSLGKRKT